MFEGKDMKTPIYAKMDGWMDAYDQPFLSEGVCQQLEILSYHTKVEQWRSGKGKPNHDNVHITRVPIVVKHLK